jgi:hypothetical protein
MREKTMVLRNQTRMSRISTAVSGSIDIFSPVLMQSCSIRVFTRCIARLTAVLDIPRDASEAEIKKAFRKLSIKHHPDKGGDKVLFQKIQRAYEVLSNEELRMVFDHAGCVMLPFGLSPTISHDTMAYMQTVTHAHATCE